MEVKSQVKIPPGKAGEEAIGEFPRMEGGRVIGPSALIRRMGAGEAPEVRGGARAQRNPQATV